MPKYISISALNNPYKVSNMCQQENGPIFIKENDEVTMVIMSYEHYNKLTSFDKFTLLKEK